MQNNNKVQSTVDPLIQMYIGFTLVDITQTNITSTKESFVNPKGRNQQRNWETLVQILSLRAQPMELELLSVNIEDLSKFKFGTDYTGKHRVWTFKFGVEHVGVYDGVEPFSILANDCNGVPIISNLDETIPLTNAIFSSDTKTKNIYFANYRP